MSGSSPNATSAASPNPKKKGGELGLGLLVQCPNCKLKQSEKNETCGGEGKTGCNFKFKKGDGKIYWIEFYADGKRKRERIGTSRKPPETTLHKRKVAISEGRKLDIVKHKKVMLKELKEDYLDYSRQNTRSWERDVTSLKHILNYFGNINVKDLTPRKIERYMDHRLSQVNKKENKLEPATVNREVACLKHMLSRALRDGKIDHNPATQAKLKPENNVRDRVLTREEFVKLRDCCREYLKPGVTMAYYTAMRKSEILNLTWDRVDLDAGFIRLQPEDTKTAEFRSVPLNPELTTMLKGIKVRSLRHNYVFTLNGEYISPLGTFKQDFKNACKDAEIEDFVFYDLRHTCINNWRQAGHDYSKIMKASGHKTIAVFKRYNTVDDEELKSLAMDTYTDTCEEGREDDLASILK